MKKKMIKLFFALFIGVNFAQSQNLDSLDVKISFHQKIKMSDGVHLSSNIYKPFDITKKYPVILVITPYISDENHSRGLFFATNGYVFITVDCRGRGNSEGNFVPFENDGKDGFDIVNWIAKQEWCDGNVGMFGGSYRGMNQWLTLKHFPKNLKSIIPIASVGPGRDFPKYNNIFYPYCIRWLTFTSGKTNNHKIFGDSYWSNKFEKLYKDGVPFNKLDSLIGLPNKTYQKWLSHPSHDAYWKQFYLTPEENKRINIPILSITGHFDGDQPGALLYYEGHMDEGNAQAKENHYLIIGPWSHGGTRRPKSELGGFKFGKNAVIDMNELYLNWFDWTLKEKEKPKLLKDRVMYYEMGSNEWRYASKLEAVSSEKKSLYLNSLNTTAKDVFNSGDLKEQPLEEDNTPDIIVDNPKLNRGLNNPTNTIRDNEYYLSQGVVNDSEVLIYHSEPLKEDITINGKIALEAYISMDVENVDLKFHAYEITKGNKSLFLQSDYVRASYREGLSSPKKVKKNEVLKYVFNGENFFSRVLKKGSRIRLVFSFIDSPYTQRNFNYWESPSYQTIDKAKKATIKLYHNKKYPSRIILPVKKQ
ncbi:CocE/NonD family hydrolase [Tenacibaculum xiamenense]|uniref:CocE/NonD family hydrolase n=1 Tax=Tenacibaculum xiamenense TaxID=1261553 RepID=UPI003892CFB5